VGLHAFTATATARVRRDIAAQLQLRAPLELVGSFDRPNLIYRVLPRASLKRQLQDVLDRQRGNAGIVYCPSRREVDALAAWLAPSGVRAVPYHAGMDDDDRHRNQDRFINEDATVATTTSASSLMNRSWFINEDADVVVATVAFGM